MSDQYPDGKMNASDEGELPLSVGVEQGKICIRFQKPVAWLGMTPDGAMEFAQLLIRHARSAGITKPFSFKL